MDRAREGAEDRGVVRPLVRRGLQIPEAALCMTSLANGLRGSRSFCSMEAAAATGYQGQQSTTVDSSSVSRIVHGDQPDTKMAQPYTGPSEQTMDPTVQQATRSDGPRRCSMASCRGAPQWKTVEAAGETPRGGVSGANGRSVQVRKTPSSVVDEA
ncbi:hypothetical protein VTN02DRAFT_5424 [Thermoascus thermophilus]